MRKEKKYKSLYKIWREDPKGFILLVDTIGGRDFIHAEGISYCPIDDSTLRLRKNQEKAFVAKNEDEGYKYVKSEISRSTNLKYIGSLLIREDDSKRYIYDFIFTTLNEETGFVQFNLSHEVPFRLLISMIKVKRIPTKIKGNTKDH